MVQGNLPVLGRPTIWTKTGQGPITFEVGAEEWGMFVIITFLYLFSPLSPCL